MVEKLVGEVARISYKDGSQAQLTLVIRDKGATKPSFEKIREHFFFHFLPTTPLLVHHDRAVLGRTAHLLMRKDGATTYFQHIIGSAKEGTAFLLKGRSGIVFSYTNLMSRPMFLLHNLGLR